MYARLHNASFEGLLAVFFQNYWKSDVHFIWKASIYMRNALRMSGLYFTCLFCVSVACFKGSTWHSFKQFFQVTTILNWGQLFGNFRQFLHNGISAFSAIFVNFCITCKQSTPGNRHGGDAWFLCNGSNPLNAHHCA